MKKRMKLYTVLCMCLVLAANMLAGCGKNGESGSGEKGNQNSATDVEIAIWNSGLGTEWLDKMIEVFTKKHPEYHVFYNASSNPNALNTALGMEDVDTVDLYMTIFTSGGGYQEYMEPLDDLVLNATADGDSVPLKDKFNAGYLALEKAEDDHYYTLTSGGGLISMYYNRELFEDAGIKQLPRTTKELTVVCDTLYNKQITPLCHFIGDGYYTYMTEVFMMQYSGSDYYLNNYYTCTDEEGKSPSKEVFTKKDGRYAALKAYEKFITPSYTLLGSNTKSHTEIQTEFINDKAAMMLNGSWIANEMKNVGSMDKIGAMKMPVISSIVDRLSTVKTEEGLRALITAIDEVTEGKKLLSDYASGEDYQVAGTIVSAEDWNTVYEARNTVGSNYAQTKGFIPKYSNAKEGAAEFMKFMYSDEGYQIFVETTHSPLPIKLSSGQGPDTSSYDDIAKFQFQLMDEAVAFADSGLANKHRIFTDGGANGMAGVLYITKLSAQDASDRMSADEVWKLIMQTVEDQYENSWLQNIK